MAGAEDGPSVIDPLLTGIERQLGPDQQTSEGGERGQVHVREELERVGHLAEDHQQEARRRRRRQYEDVDRPQPVQHHVPRPLEPRAALDVEHSGHFVDVESDVGPPGEVRFSN